MNALSQEKGKRRRNAGWLGWMLAGLCWFGWGASSPAHAQVPHPLDASKIWVANNDDNTVEIYDAKTHKLITKVELGPKVDKADKEIGSLKSLHNGEKIFVIYKGVQVVIIDTAWEKHEFVGRIVRRVDVGGVVLDVAVSPDDRWACVMSRDPLDNSLKLTVIDTFRNNVVGERSLGNDVKGLRNSKGLGMSVSQNGTVYLLTGDSSGNGQLLTRSPNGDVRSTAVTRPYGMDLSPDGQFIYVSNQPEGSAGPQVQKFEAKTGNLVSSAPLDLQSPSSMKVSPDGQNIYLVDKDQKALIVLEASSLGLKKRVDLPGFPMALALSNDGSIRVTISGDQTTPGTKLVTISPLFWNMTGTDLPPGAGSSVASITGWEYMNFGTGNGSALADANDVLNLQGSGTVALGGTSDNNPLFFQYAPPSSSIAFRVLNVQGGDVGPQIRTNADANAANFFPRLVSSGGGLVVGATFRTKTGEPTGFPGQIAEVPLGSEVCAQINDKDLAVFTGLTGDTVMDRALWHVAGDPVDPPQGPVLMGIALASATPGGTVTARIDRVRVQPWVLLPYGMKAVGSDRAVTLTWKPVPWAARYHVYRGPHGGALKDFVLLQVVDGTAYRDTSPDLKNGTTYDYAVAVEKARPVGTPGVGDLVALPATPVGLPAGMFGCSIAEGTNSGTVTFDAQRDSYTLRGYGFGIQRNGDQCYFAGQVVEGNKQAYATLLNDPTAANGSTAGLMLRETLFAGSRYMGILVHPTSGLVATWRSSTDGPTVGQVLIPKAQLTYPLQIAISRVGDRIWFGAALSGKPFAWITSVVQPPSGPTYAGMALTSNNRQQPAEVPFSRFGIQ
jgi:WD40 repeat protein